MLGNLFHFQLKKENQDLKGEGGGGGAKLSKADKKKAEKERKEREKEERNKVSEFGDRKEDIFACAFIQYVPW